MRSELLYTTIIDLYNHAMKAGVVPRTIAIEGAPGGGKTTIVHEAAKAVRGLDGKVGVPYIENHMPTMLVEDFGIPYPDADNDKSFSYKLPHWFPYKGKPGTENGGILLFDDRNQASPDLQKVLANICQARNLHGVPLADGWMVISTGNRQKDRAGANRVLSHLRNRETVLEFETHLDDWTGWAIKHNVKSEVISFIRFRPGLLHDFDPQRDQNATPRSWVEGVSDVIGTVSPVAELECIKGAVGDGPASEFLGFLRTYRNLPDPDQVLLNPDKAAIPKDPATMYALSGALATRANAKNFDNLVKYCNRIPAEFSVLTVSYAVRREVALANSSAFAKWADTHQNVLF